MRHFSLEQWADFARDLVGKEKKAVMQEHLESGCKPCAKIHKEWSRVREVAGRERAYQPPESAVRAVKGMGAIHARPAKPGIAQLLFDSSRSPVAAGVRSASTIARQLLYGVGAYRIDVRMEPQMDSDKISLVGQVLNSAEPAKHVGDVPVALLKGRKVVGESQTNAFGEFHLECDLEGRLELRFILPQGMEVRIPLVEPAKGSFAGDLEAVESEKVKRNTLRSRQSTRKRVL